MIECVDYHEDLGLMIYSEQDFPPENDHCLNLSSCEYEVGYLNNEHKFISNGKRLMDYGFDFYAPQIMNDDHYLIGWLAMWDRNHPSAKYGFAGMLTVPRKVKVEDGLMLQTPVIYGDLNKAITIEKEYKDYLSVGTLVLEVEDLKSLHINLRQGDDEVTEFYLKDDEFYFNRSKSGEIITGSEKDEWSLRGIRKMPYRKQKKDEIYIVLDKYSVEIFVNGLSISNVIYPKESSDIFSIFVDSVQSSLKIYK